MKKITTLLLAGFVFGVSHQALAQASVEKGKSVAIEIPVDSDTACNIEVTRGGEKTNVSVDPKSKKGIYEFAGRELGEETIRWEGKMRFRGLKTLGPCKGDGLIKVATIEPGSNNSAASENRAPAKSESAENKSTETASAATPSPQVQPPPPAAPENFQVFSRKGEYGYEMLKKLDGSTVFADPSKLRSDQSFCPITLSQSYDQAGLAAVLSAMPQQLNQIFSGKGMRNNVKFSAVECIRGSGNNLNLGGGAPLVVVQQSAVAQLSVVPGFDRYETFGAIDGNALMAEAKRLADEKAAALAAVASRNDELARLAEQKSKEKIGSVTLAYPQGGDNLRLCTRKGDETFKLATNGYFATKDLRLSKGYIDAAIKNKSRLNRKSPITNVYQNLDDFYLAIQRDPRVCEVYVDYPENLKILADALKEKPYELNRLVPVTELKNDWAQEQGYPDFEMYELTKSIGGDARMAEQLVSFKVTNTQSFNDAVNRMKKQGYSQEQDGPTVLSFLIDEKAGTETKKSAVAVRNERVRLAEIEEKKRAAEEKAAAAARAAAEAERNKPLQKSGLKPDITYKWYDDSSCTNSESEQCLNINQYKQMCDWANGLTVNVRRMAAVMFNSPYSQFLSEGGEFTDSDYGWNSRIGQCRVSWSIVGMFKGTNVRENFSGYASNFIVTKNGKVLIHYVSGR